MLTVIHPGLLTTVQDQGRPGWQRYGVAVGGVSDSLSARIANILVGNDPAAAVLEMTQVGPELSFPQDTLIAWCGGDFPARVQGEPLPKQRAVRIAAGETIAFPFAPSGWRGWLAVAGGFAEAPVLGSRSTCGRSGFGGHGGRALLAGDTLPLGPASPWASKILEQLRIRTQRSSSWSVVPASLGQPPPKGTVRTLRGPEWEWFTPETHRRWLTAEWRVAAESDRMGMRLTGPPLTLRTPREMISSAVTSGVVQVPASKQPIVLLTDCQTVGGYPRLASVAGVDLGLLAQARPGDRIRFTEITLAEAHALRARQETHLRLARVGLARFADGA